MTATRRTPTPRRARTAAVLTAFIAGGAAGFAYAGYRQEILRARRRVAMGSQVVQTACGPIEYAVAGRGPPVLLVHGAGGGYDQGMLLGAPLASGFHAIAVSRFGYLRTPLPTDASPAAQADAHACLLDALNIERAAVVGASAGAPSSLQFALRHPDRCTAMVLLVPAAYAPRPEPGPPLQTPAWTEFLLDTALRSDFLFWAAMHVARPVMIQSILGTPLEVLREASDEEHDRVRQVMEHVLPVGARRLGLRNDAAVVSKLERYELERITVPTLVIGVQDCLYGTFEPARYTARQIPGARFIDFETGGHLWVGHHDEVGAAIVSFLRENQSPTNS